VFVVEQNAQQALRLADRGYVWKRRIVFGDSAANLLVDRAFVRCTSVSPSRADDVDSIDPGCILRR